jgi:hypothetical protein
MSKIFQAEQHEGETVTTDSPQHEDESVTTNSLMNPLASRVHRDSQQEMPDIIRQKNLLAEGCSSVLPSVDFCLGLMITADSSNWVFPITTCCFNPEFVVVITGSCE